MKARYLFGLGTAAAVLAIVALRSNAAHSLELRARILQKDQAGAEVTEDINELRQFVFSHMNSSVRFELKGAYQRAVAAAQGRAASSAGSRVYAKAQAACGPEVGTNSVAQVACVQAYLDANLNRATNTAIDLPQPAEYNYAFASPGWRPDLAGLSSLAAVALILAALVRYIWGLFKSRVQTSG